MIRTRRYRRAWRTDPVEPALRASQRIFVFPSPARPVVVAGRSRYLPFPCAAVLPDAFNPLSRFVQSHWLRKQLSVRVGRICHSGVRTAPNGSVSAQILPSANGPSRAAIRVLFAASPPGTRR
ncbi:hypothetical protein Bphy_2280 [Paraburkholderia phymatum STM815]|uniref:Uncharacterized protein n=1 Tax=Paraburkholderia phymatum (strain DSM 17167 / CIP 108236 / LMG 21445 / STM815) TaxID=391038 RepID=B2JF87_PARP8|nr:hypothetical protein Bphy_2280 [Paraburkholderia phymatum STM815]